VNPQFVDGYKNREYVSPTYHSNVNLPQASSPGKVNAREDTSYKVGYPAYRSTNPFKRADSHRRTDTQDAKSDLQAYDDGRSKSRLSRSEVGAPRTPRAEISEVKIQPARVEAQSQVEANVPRTQEKERPSNAQNQKTPQTRRRDEERPEFLRSKSKRDDRDYHNPTFRSQILTSGQKEPKPQPTGWETTTRTAYDMPIALQDEQAQSTLKQSDPLHSNDDRPYKPWRRQPTEHIQSPKKYDGTEDAPYSYPSPRRQQTLQPDNDLEKHYYMQPGKEVTDAARDLMYRNRKDDQIFPHNVNYAGDHNEIIHEESAVKLYRENPVYRQVNDDRIGYTDGSIRVPRANEILAAERREREEGDRVRVRGEEQNQLRRAAELEDRNERDNERRRDYR
jgi:hypothetical protein